MISVDGDFIEMEKQFTLYNFSLSSDSFNIENLLTLRS